MRQSLKDCTLNKIGCKENCKTKFYLEEIFVPFYSSSHRRQKLFFKFLDKMFWLQFQLYVFLFKAESSRGICAKYLVVCSYS